MQIGTFNVRRIVITVMVLLVAGLTATAALANSAHFKKGRGPNCLMAGSAISKSVTCSAGLAVPASVPDNNNTLPYDEFGLSANQPNQPQVGNAGPQTGRAVVHSPRRRSHRRRSREQQHACLDEFGLSANQPNQPQVGNAGPQTGRASSDSPRPPPFPCQRTVPDNNNTLPYDEFGLSANQPNQPRSVTPARKPDSGETHLREGAASRRLLQGCHAETMA